MKLNTLRTIGLEEVYQRLDKQILLAQQYCEIPDLGFILKSCRLKPIKYVKNKNNKLVLYREWFDEFRSTLRIDKNKQVKVTLNDLNIDITHQPCTDIYYGLNIKNVLKISNISYIQYGKCEITGVELCCICCLGIDNYFRTFIFDGSWSQTSSLAVGLGTLKLIKNSIDLSKTSAIMSPAIEMSFSKQWLVPTEPYHIKNIFSQSKILKKLT